MSRLTPAQRTALTMIQSADPGEVYLVAGCSSYTECGGRPPHTPRWVQAFIHYRVAEGLERAGFIRIVGQGEDAKVYLTDPPHPATTVGIDRQPFGTHLWGFTCRACGFEQRGVLDRVTAEEHADTHRCAPSQQQRLTTYAGVATTNAATDVCAVTAPATPPYESADQDFLADLDEPRYDLVERPGKALTHRLTCIRCRGPRRDGNALCRRCRWSPRRAWRLWRNR